MSITTKHIVNDNGEETLVIELAVPSYNLDVQLAATILAVLDAHKDMYGAEQGEPEEDNPTVTEVFNKGFAAFDAYVNRVGEPVLSGGVPSEVVMGLRERTPEEQEKWDEWIVKHGEWEAGITEGMMFFAKYFGRLWA